MQGQASSVGGGADAEYVQCGECGVVREQGRHSIYKHAVSCFNLPDLGVGGIRKLLVDMSPLRAGRIEELLAVSVEWGEGR